MNKYIIKRLSSHDKFHQTMKIMRITSFFLFLNVLFIQAGTSFSQEAKLTINLRSTTIKEACRQIERQSSYIFVFSDNIENALNKKINIEANSRNIKEVCDDIFSMSGLSYKILDKQVVVYAENAKNVSKIISKLETKDLIQQVNFSVKGKITDESGEPLIGVSVVVVGNLGQGTVSDLNGNYVINNVSPNASLRFSYVGMKTQVIPINSRTVINVVLTPEAEVLNELVVIGYGTRQRKSITGSVDQLNSAVFEDRPVTNAMQALQGASANLIIQQKNMNPNDNNLSINIRGVSTMGNNDPLVVIDGLISSTSTLNNLNPNDIENVSILKDAGSAAIYGSRSANGVILVTTKKGSKSQKPVVRLNGMVGYENPDILFQPVEGWQNAMYRNEANMNVGSDPAFTPAQIRDLYDHRNEEYWYFNEIMEKGLQQNYNFNVSGGSDNTTYMISAGYLNQESNFVGDFGVERYNLRSNMSVEYGKFKLTSLMAYVRKNERTIAGGTGNVIINSSRIPPYYYYKFQQDGKYLINDVVGDDNTLARLLDGGNENKDEDNFIESLNLDYKIIEGLTAKGLVGLDLTQHHRFRRDKKVPLYSSADLETPVLYMNSNTLTEDYNQKRHTLSTQFMLDFDRTFSTLHHVTGLLGVSNESYTLKASRIAWEYTDEDLGLPTTDESKQSIDNYNSNANTDQTSITSLFGRVGYDYRNKYYGDFSFRYDGSSKFAKDHRWGFFPSFSAAWRLTEETFMENYKSRVGDLKFRTSYGILGNQNVDNYSYQTVYQMYSNIYVFNNQSLPGTGYTVGNPLLTWEKSANFNVGVDATFFKNTLYVSLDYFNKRTWDILLSREVSSVYGSSAAKENLGEMQNRGWETTVTYKLKSGDFSHNISLNVADSKNKVTNFGGNERIDQSDQMYKIIREGEALGSYFGYKTDGVFQSYEEIANSALPIGASVQPGDVKYVDSYKDGVIDEKDRVVLGNAFPRMTYGLTYDVTFKGFDLGLLIQGVGKRDMFVRGELIEPFHSNYSYCIYRHQLDFWTPTNPNARWPRLVAPGSSSSANNWGKAGSDIYLLDGAYLRVKNIQLGYTLPKVITSKMGIQKLRFNVNAQNPITLSKNSFIDPESSEFGNNMGGIGGVGANSARNYPTLIYYGLGIDVEF